MADEHIITTGPRIQQVSVLSGEPRGYQQLTVSTAALGLTIPKNANACMIIVENASIRYRDDGTDPTGDVGMLVFPANMIQLNTAVQMAAFKAIRETSMTGDSTLNISYYEKK